MVRPADPNQATQAHSSPDLTDDSCVCPQCYKPLKAPTVSMGNTYRYGPRLRTYGGRCFNCQQTCRVEQFEDGGNWVIHSYLRHRYEDGQFIGFGEWVEVNPLPKPPPVLNGPGGDFDKVPDPSNDPAISAILSISTILMQTTSALGNLLEGIKRSQDNELNNRKH